MRRTAEARLKPVQRLIATVAAVLIVVDFIRIDGASHSVSDTLINWVPQALGAIVIAALLTMAVRRVAPRGP
jgi:hypothetical protein